MPYSTVCGLISLSLLLYAQPQCVDCISVHVYVQHTLYSLHYVYLSYFHHQQKQVVCSYVFLWKLTLRKPSRDHINIFQRYFFLIYAYWWACLIGYWSCMVEKNANKNICLYWSMNKIYTSNLNATPSIMTFMVRKLIISGGWREMLGCYSILPIPTRKFLLFHYSQPLPTSLFHYSTGKLPLFLFYNSC